MKSNRPKVLHEILGRPMVVRLIDSLVSGPAMQFVIVVGHGADRVQDAIMGSSSSSKPVFAIQSEQLGTGHAVASGLTRTPRSCQTIVVVNGDLPNLRSATEKLVAAHRRSRCPVTIATMTLDAPEGYGRILRSDSGRIATVREQRDCSAKEAKIREVNAGLYCFSRPFLEENITRLGRGNRQKEFYLTDMVEIATSLSAGSVMDVDVDPAELKGINDRAELADLEHSLLCAVRTRHMKAGVGMVMPETSWIEEMVTIGRDTVIHPRVLLKGSTSIGSGCVIGTGTVIEDSHIEDGAVVKPYCVFERASVGKEAIVGPFARLRPGSEVGPEAHVGNFVELKNTTMGRGSKANHLSYLGDGEIGEGVNVGAGTIFCNYDGYSKHKTILEDGVFVGSDSQMVAPVRIGRGSYVGSGSTITSDVPADSLAVARARQVIKKGRAPMLRELLISRKQAVKRTRTQKRSRTKPA
jgi:bifunctional UDP-N-acetylglucosamine pyrophosphorylase/glucosamine-1-phosphate N-acetyltransferase